MAAAISEATWECQGSSAGRRIAFSFCKALNLVTVLPKKIHEDLWKNLITIFQFGVFVSVH